MATTTNDFLSKKFSHFFHVLDFDGDGVVTRNDYVQMGERFASVSDVDDKRKEEIKKHFLGIWDEMFANLSTESRITPDQFVKNLTEIGEQGRKKISETTAPLMFKAVDADGDGLIQLQEYRNYYKLLKNKDEAADESFKTIDLNHDGCISLEEYNQGFLDFFTSEDQTSPNRHFFGPL